MYINQTLNGGLQVKSNTACFTGHRPNKLPWGYNENMINCKIFKQDLKAMIESLINLGITTFFTGMAEGFDMISAEIVLNLKNKFPEIKLIAVIPCLGQEIKWNLNQQKRYINLINQCDKKIVLSRQYTQTCMNDRNRSMVDNSSIVIACFNGNPGGTQNTIRYAKQQNCKLKIINPVDYNNV